MKQHQILSCCHHSSRQKNGPSFIYGFILTTRATGQVQKCFWFHSTSSWDWQDCETTLAHLGIIFHRNTIKICQWHISAKLATGFLWSALQLLQVGCCTVACCGSPAVWPPDRLNIWLEIDQKSLCIVTEYRPLLIWNEVLQWFAQLIPSGSRKWGNNWTINLPMAGLHHRVADVQWDCDTTE